MTSRFKYIFLDRDGVINEERPNDYVKESSEFVFIKGSIESIALLTKKMDRVFIVTNQRGVGRGIMTKLALDEVHIHMLAEIQKAGGEIDAIYLCCDICSTSINRKPNVGMAFRAQSEYPEVDFDQSILVGNSLSDIIFGNKMGMFTVLVGDKYPQSDNIYDIVNAYYKNLYKFAIEL